MADPANGPFRSVPITLRVSVGAARPTLAELSRLGPEDVLALDRGLDDPVELIAGDRVVARGELVEVDGAPGRLAIRITQLVGGAGDG